MKYIEDTHAHSKMQLVIQCCILYKLSYPVYQQLIKTELNRNEQQTKANENRLDSNRAKQQINSRATKHNMAITE